MSRAFGIVNFAGNNIQGNPMQAYRPTGAISFLGRYRVIDFPISNMSNSGIDSIQVYIRRKPVKTETKIVFTVQIWQLMWETWMPLRR